MADRATETTVTFRHPFTLISLDRPLPPGTYQLVRDEEKIFGLSFLAFQRTAMMLHIPISSLSDRRRDVILVNSAELTDALEADGRA